MTNTLDFIAIVLAAGQGTRMKSDRPKVLHELAGRPMICYPVQAALNAGAERVVTVLGHGRDQVEHVLKQHFDDRVITAIQPEQLGTGDAARCGFQALDNYQGWLLIFYADCPLITPEALQTLLQKATASTVPLALLVCCPDDPSGYGRIIRNEQGVIVAIREDRDCDEDELQIDEINPGFYAVKSEFFGDAITRLSHANAQGELYLTDLIEMASNEGGVEDLFWEASELMGINDRFELSEAEMHLRLRIAQEHALNGVTIRDPLNTYIDADVSIERDAVIEPNVTLRGPCVIGAGAVIDVGCVLTDVSVKEKAHLLPYTVATQSEIGEQARIGPFSHLRPASRLGPECHIGNFVETKKTTVGRASKANHLAYLGDGIIGERVNVGAGTIFCNYDGYNKHTTILEDDSFIGSDSQMVAPLTVGKGSYVATGTTLTKNVPQDALAISRVRQENKEGMAVKFRRQMEAKKRKDDTKT